MSILFGLTIASNRLRVRSSLARVNQAKRVQLIYVGKVRSLPWMMHCLLKYIDWLWLLPAEIVIGPGIVQRRLRLKLRWDRGRESVDTVHMDFRRVRQEMYNHQWPGLCSGCLFVSARTVAESQFWAHCCLKRTTTAEVGTHVAAVLLTVFMEHCVESVEKDVLGMMNVW